MKSISIAKKGNKFSLREFMEEVRGIMGVPEWFLYTDSRKTRADPKDNCVAMQIHFAGPHANVLEQDFNQLLITGKLSRPSIRIPGYIPDQKRKTKLGYKECASGKNKKQKSRTSKSSSLNRAKSIMSAGPHSVWITTLSFVIIYTLYFS